MTLTNKFIKWAESIKNTADNKQDAELYGAYGETEDIPMSLYRKLQDCLMLFDEKKQKKILLQIVAKAPYFIDAQLELAKLEPIPEMFKQLTDLLKELDEKEGYIFEELSLMRYLADLYFENNMLFLAKELYEKLYEVNQLLEKPLFDVTPRLLMISCLLLDKKRANQLFKSHPSYKQMDSMLLPMISLFIQLGNEQNAINYANQLLKVNPNVKELLQDLDELIEIVEEYVPYIDDELPDNSEESFVSILTELAMYHVNPDFMIEWLVYLTNEKNRKKPQLKLLKK